MTIPPSSLLAAPAPSAFDCAVNIGPAERRRRMAFGLAVFSVGLGMTVALVASGAHPLWRLGLFFPFAAAAVGYFQAHEKT